MISFFTGEFSDDISLIALGLGLTLVSVVALVGATLAMTKPGPSAATMAINAAIGGSLVLGISLDVERAFVLVLLLISTFPLMIASYLSLKGVDQP